MRKLQLLTLLVVLVCAFAFHFADAASPAASFQDAIALAAAYPAFAKWLSERSGWTADAYYTGNGYGIWRVQFYDAAGEDLGWADVNVEKGRVYSWETHYGALETQRQAAEEVVTDFVVNSPEVLELIEDPGQYPMYVDYDGWSKAWGVYIERGMDSLYVVVQFEGLTPTSLSNPHLVSVYFPNVLPYEDWYSASQERVIALAFEQPAIAGPLRNYDGWDATAELLDEGATWEVIFSLGDQELARAVVDTSTESVEIVGALGLEPRTSVL
jgi:hypothetical protein